MTGPQHLDRLGAFDASFLLQEGPTSYAHIGGVVVVEGPPPSIREMRAQISGRLGLVPRYRQRLAHTPLDRARPVWVDDTNFDIDYHVRHIALPRPGDREQLRTAVASAYGQALDRSRPLWETWLVEGLEGDRFAMIFKAHHALIDGSAAIDLLKMLCDVTPDPAPAPAALAPWQPQPTPGMLDLLVHGARESARTAASQLAAGAVEVAREPTRRVRQALDVAEGAGKLILQLLRTPPKTPLTTKIGRHRRFVEVSCRLDDAKLVKDTFGGTVNDVVLSVVTGALRTFLENREVSTDGLELSALVPVSVRREDERGRMGNRVAVLRATLPVHVADPVARLGVVTESMTALKNSNQAVGSESVLRAQDYLPPMVLPITTRINASPRMFNVMATNIPGPQMPLYVLGRRLVEVFPIALLHPGHPLAIAIASYDGQLNFGILGDYDAMPDIAVVADAISAGLMELTAKSRPSAVPEPPARSRPTLVELREAALATEG
ncbi:MAG: diacylglycerol O-acyltransferase / wax synthase [Solirubrobacteraceae bacterium]|jgi:WS/DGAT/MGAT family acyltransferase|nr:diacylglycerol O-acyltransferase / wax synthase [Solirubrobacteraceae bacterium]